MAEEKSKLSLPELEEKILKFWEDNKIFEKSIEQRKNSRRFVFYDGPPFATGLPHYGHILASTIKDVVPRYWTMRGFRVDRRWGWDCHGLPIEHLVEQELNISGRKAIEKLGIKKFNETARSRVLIYTSEWAKTVRRIGRFVNFENYYATMQPTYMESVWWAFATLYKKGLVYKDSRTALFCPRCETQLSNFEIAMDNSYRDQEDDSVYVKLPLKGTKNEFLLIWTTTPWTLPGNVVVAVNPHIEYTKYKIGKEYIWSVTTPAHEAGVKISVSEKISGKSLIGKGYEPLFSLTNDARSYRVVGAEFVDIKEGTGLVHIAPAFGEEDFILGKAEHLPIISTLDDTGRFNDQYPALRFLQGKKAEEANRIIIEWLRTRHLLWKVQRITHRYPICWRCQTSLLYKVEPAWFIKISAIKKKMLALNEKIDWHPEHLKHGRFGNDLETAPDWNVSRSRFWGTPIPIWECTSCKKIHVIASREEFHKMSGGAKNRYFIMRHGEAENNIKNIISSSIPEKPARHLTPQGKLAAENTAKKLKNKGIDLIVSSDFVRTKETAQIVAEVLGVEVAISPRLREITGLDGFPSRETEKYISNFRDRLTKKVPGGETIPEVRSRIFSAISDLEKKYHGKTILLIGHEHPLWILYAASGGLTDEEMFRLRTGKRKEWFIRYAEAMEMPYQSLPRNDTGGIDFHRPYVDEVPLFCECGGETKRVPDVFDCWFESGSMPFAQNHYPFENKALFEKNFPADFIAEYIAQTRGWFNKLHVLSTGLFGKPAFKHAVTTGTILSENGEKLSKSRKNFPDPQLLFDRYGVDAIRYYLMASSVMRAGNINFSEKDVDEIYKKFSLILYNVLSLFKLYGGDRQKGGGPGVGTSSHVLDRWILSRLHSTIRDVTASYDAYEIADAMRPLLNFAQDLSLWYVRRSRDRIKSGGRDAKDSLSTLRSVLFDFSRLIAPVTPFLAEIIYRELGMKRKLSVHLEDWPRFEKKLVQKELEEKIVEVRNIVSQALRKRAEAGIRVRQPLPKLQIPTDVILRRKQKNLRRSFAPLRMTAEDAALLELVKDEVNVKEITFGGEIELDTVITPELKEEGMAREIIRNIQEMRKDLRLRPQDKIRLQFSGEVDALALIGRWEKAIAGEAGIKDLVAGGKKVFEIERELDLDGQKLWIGISRIS